MVPILVRISPQHLDWELTACIDHLFEILYRHCEPYYNASLPDEAWDTICRVFADDVREVSGLSDPEQRRVFKIHNNMRKRRDWKTLETKYMQ